MNAALPKPTSPQTTPPSRPVGSPGQAPADTQTVFEKPSDPTASTPLPSAPQKPEPQRVQLGGRSIPLPPNKSSSLKPADASPSAGVNPALAPKPAAAPLTSVTPNPAGLPAKKAGQAARPAAPPAGVKMASARPSLLSQIQENPKKWLLIILGGIVGAFLLFWLISRIFGGGTSAPVQNTNTPVPPGEQIVLAYWGLWEPSAVLEEVISEYEAAHPGISIDYRVQSHKDYRERLQTAIASGNGPDIFRYHASWAPAMASDLATIPGSIMSEGEFQNTFYPITAQQLQVDGKLAGLPVMYDGLVLYYNINILQAAGAQPPATWAELKQLANQLTVPSDRNQRANGTIQRSGLAIGNASNVDHFSDILGLLILQNGGDPGEPAFAEVRDALLFYTNFVKEDLVWNGTLPSSTVAFARGDAAMMFAPSWRAHEIKELNPDLQFATAPVPQLSENAVAWANYWAEGVNQRSTRQTQAWEFLRYLTQADVMKKLYSAQAQVRSFGEPYSRVDLASELQDDPYVGAVLQDAPIAKAWFMASATHDNSLNDNVIGYYRTAVNAVLAGENMDDVLLALERGVKQEVRQYYGLE
jgi:multiple sugar transport system substrate-binding protein